MTSKQSKASGKDGSPVVGDVLSKQEAKGVQPPSPTEAEEQAIEVFKENCLWIKTDIGSFLNHNSVEQAARNLWHSRDKEIQDLKEDAELESDTLIIDLRGFLDAVDFAELKQCVSDLISELEEKRSGK